MKLRILILVGLVTAACGDGGGPGLPSRSYLMGFSAIPPRFDSSTANLIAAIDNWIPHADAAIMHVSPPWAALLAGHTPAGAVDTVELPLAQYYRAKGLDIVFTVDVTDGLNRAAEAPELVAAGRSITDTMVQRLYREWTYAVALKIQPRYLGLAAETNLIRVLAPDSVYQAVVTMTNAVAAQISAASLPSKLFVSIQVETAWGRLPPGPFVGIAQDRSDFPFMQAIGLSSYPYLGGFTEPESVPLDYYSRIAQGTVLPVLVVEGGWASISLDTIVSSPAEQARYIERQEQLLDSARAQGVFQLTFYDLDLSNNPQPPGSILPLFAHLGLADSAMHPKPALDVWDTIRRRPHVAYPPD
ncbi:MAG TPA: hypothetical protein VN803_12535 [Gemmatimonadales bacterium]|nr:hypothetical protein [Gemmatimonadales bacterium]